MTRRSSTGSGSDVRAVPRGVPRPGLGGVLRRLVRHAHADRDLPDRHRADHLGARRAVRLRRRAQRLLRLRRRGRDDRLVGAHRPVGPAPAAAAGRRACTRPPSSRWPCWCARARPHWLLVVPTVLFGFTLPVGRVAGAGPLDVRARRTARARHRDVAGIGARRADLRHRPADRDHAGHPDRPGARALRRRRAGRRRLAVAVDAARQRAAGARPARRAARRRRCAPAAC